MHEQVNFFKYRYIFREFLGYRIAANLYGCVSSQRWASSTVPHLIDIKDVTLR